MKMPALPLPADERIARTPAIRLRAQLPALATKLRPAPAPATHDFLVPNPRPDLSSDTAAPVHSWAPR